MAGITYLTYLKFFLYLVAGLLAGYFLEKVVLAEIRALTRKTKWEFDNMILNSLQGLITIAGIIIAFYFAYPYIPFLLRYHNLVNKLIQAALILLATIASVRFAGELVYFYMRKQEGALPSTSIFVNLTKVIVFALGFLILLQTLGVAITPIITTLGVGGLAVALALQETLSNLFAGLQLLAAKQLKPGDLVKLESGEFGYVVDITWRNTTIKDFSENLIIIPNSRLSSAIVMNYNLPEKIFKLKVPVGVAYGTDLEKAEKLAIEEAKGAVIEVEGKEPPEEPFVRFQEFGDSSINFTVFISVNDFQNQYAVRHTFIKRLHRRYGSEGIEIPFPIRTVYLRRE